MTRCLVIGLKEPAGGLEQVVLAYTKAILEQFDDIAFDFLIYDRAFSRLADIEAMGARVLFVTPRREDFAANQKETEAIFRDNHYNSVWFHVCGLTNIDVLKFAKQYGVPNRIVHSHVSNLSWGSPVMRYVVPALHTVNKNKVDRYATDFWACSEKAGQFMFPKRVYDRLRIIPNPVDTARFAFSSEIRQEKRASLEFGDAPVFGHVGRMCTEKNQRFLLEIFSGILKKEPRAKLLFVGDGELHEEIYAATQALGLSQSVVFTGATPDVPQLLDAMDVFLLPSLSEGFPVTLVEAQVNGLPCVVSAEAVPRETDFGQRIRFLSLDQPVELWTKEALAALHAGRIDNGVKLAEAAGYDVKAAAKTIQNLFCEQTD